MSSGRKFTFIKPVSVQASFGGNIRTTRSESILENYFCNTVSLKIKGKVRFSDCMRQGTSFIVNAPFDYEFAAILNAIACPVLTGVTFMQMHGNIWDKYSFRICLTSNFYFVQMR